MHIYHIVHEEQRPFSYLDFMAFGVGGQEYRMVHGTFRNKVSHLIKEGLVEISYKSSITFYTLCGTKFGKDPRTRMTGGHAGVPSSSVSLASKMSSNPLYRIIRDLPLGRSSVHDIRLKFVSPQIYAKIYSSISNKAAWVGYRVNSKSLDILLPVWKIRGLILKVTIHRTDTVSIMIGCSLDPVTLDINGIIRLTNALSIVEGRLSGLIEASQYVQDLHVIDDASKFFPNHCSYYDIIPSHSEWIVTMWHFGADALTEYSGEKFAVTWETAENVLIRAYSKVMEDNSTKIRLERQEYPKACLATVIEQKLAPDGRFY
jgi:hypothetical protein